MQLALAAAFVFRLALAIVPGLPHHTGDTDSYLDPGINLFAHGTFALTCDPRCIPTLLRTPGYPLFVGVLLGLLKLPVAVLYVSQALLETFTTLLAAAIAWALGGRRAAAMAGWLYATNPFAAVFAGQIMTESLATFTLMCIVYLLWRCHGDEPPRRPLVSSIVLGLLLGFATLVRPVLTPLPAFLAVATFDRTAWREQLRRWTVAAGAFALVVGPWVARNWLVTRDNGADDSFRILGSTFSPFYRRIATPGVVHWYLSFEEPFLWDRPREAPVFARYFLPDEKQRVEELFEGIRLAGVEVTPELDAGFERLARERTAAHPFRTTLLPPLSRAVRLWITPRLSALGIEAARVPGRGGMLLLVAATGYNAALALAGFAMGILLLRKGPGRLLLIVPLYLTGIHSVIMFGCQSRYTMPALADIAVLSAVGALAVFDRTRASSRLRLHAA